MELCIQIKLFQAYVFASLVYIIKSVLTQHMLTSDSQVGADELDEQMLHPV